MKSRWDDEKNVGENLARMLPRMAKSWFAAGDHAMRRGADPEEMHRFRTLTKRFRYTLEIFGPLYGPSLRTRIEQLRDLQTRLGEVNDYLIAEALVGDSPDGKKLRTSLRKRARSKAAELRRLWTEKFAAAERHAGWERYLARFAGRHSAKRR